MTIKTTQKVIRIGTSVGVTIPANTIRQQGIKPGDEVRVTFELIKSHDDIMNEYAAFKARYGETLKKLADR